MDALVVPKPKRFAPEREFRCAACQDSGMQAMTSGWWDVSHDVGRTNRCEATSERPIYRVCKGSFEMSCPWRKHVASGKRDNGPDGD